MALPPPPPGFVLDSGGLGRPVIQRNPQPSPQTAPQRRKDEIAAAEGEATLPYAGPTARANAIKAQAEADNARAAAGETPGWKAADEAFAKEWVSWKTAGGFSDVGKQLSQLRAASQALKTKDNLTGPIVGNTPDFISNMVNPQAVATRESVEEVVQRSLRAVLGSQFTEKEGERLIARAYNPRQPESENRLRVARLRLQLTQAAKAKEEAARYFEKKGTLRGWSGKLWSFTDFDPERNSPNPPPQSRGAGDVDEILKKYGL